MTSPTRRGEQLAAQFRQHHGLGGGPLVFSSHLLQSLGADLIILELPTSLDAFALRDPVTETAVLGINIHQTPFRQRFTIAHEIGHLVAGDIANSLDSLVCQKSHPDEVLANSFARNLLCPKESLAQNQQILKASSDGDYLLTLNDTVRGFQVSPEVALIQLKDANMVPQSFAFEGTASSLATAFGWQVEYNEAVQRALLPRSSEKLATDTVAAYQEGHVPVAAVALASGRYVEEIVRDFELAHAEQHKDTPHIDPFAHLNDFFGDDLDGSSTASSSLTPACC